VLALLLNSSPLLSCAGKAFCSLALASEHIYCIKVFCMKCCNVAINVRSYAGKFIIRIEVHFAELF